MTLTLDIEGLSLCHFNKHRLAVAMLNSSAEASLDLPEHLPTLVLPRSAVSETRSTNLDEYDVALPGRIRDDKDSNVYRGWNLNGVTLRVGSGNASPRRAKPGTSALHPDAGSPNWDDMWWVLDIRRLAQGALLEEDVLEVGDKTRCIAYLTGGSAKGAPPQRDNHLCDFVWDFSPQHRQAITDSLRYELPSEVGADSINITLSCPGRPTTTIVVTADAVGHLINEATPGAIMTERGKPSAGVIARHARAYYERFYFVGGKIPPAPVRGQRFRGRYAVDGVFCVVLTMGAD